MSLEVYGDEGNVHDGPVCGICGKPFDTEMQVQDHIDEEHPEKDRPAPLDVSLRFPALSMLDDAELARLVTVINEIRYALSEYLYEYRTASPNQLEPRLIEDLQDFRHEALVCLRRAQDRVAIRKAKGNPA